MSAHYPVLVFFLAAGLVFVLPLVPAFLELWFPRDLRPLDLRLGAKDTAFFARAFEEALRDSLPEEFESDFIHEKTGELKNGIPYRIVGELSSGTSPGDQLVLSGRSLAFAGAASYRREIYGAEDLRFGEDAQIAAAFARGTIILERGCRVEKWLHAGLEMECAASIRLNGRASCDGVMRLENDTRFKRLKAKQIEFLMMEAYRERAGERLAYGESIFRRRLANPTRRVSHHDLRVAAGEEVTGDLIAYGNVIIEEGARIWGSVKSHRSIQCADDVMVKGNLVAMEHVRVGRGCLLLGSVISELGTLVGPLSVLGSPRQPVTLSTGRLRVSEGVMVHGTIWTELYGFVRRA